METQIGSLVILFGPMFSGKSSEGLRRLRRAEAAGLSALVIKYAKDQRYANDFSTHDRVTQPALATMELMQCLSTARKFAFILIDEGQFFSDLVPFCTQLVNEGKVLVIASLDSTFEMKRFGTAVELIPICDEVVKLTAICRGCGAPAPFSKRLVDAEQEQLIGGEDLYAGVCRGCYFLSVEELKQRHANYLEKRKMAKILLNDSLG
jgi:thymidine kinase